MTRLWELTATELVAGYVAGEFTPVDATRETLAAIERANPSLNAFVMVDAESALADARASTARYRAGTPAGPADGVPTSIKDIFYTRGWPTLRGSTLVDEAGPWDVDAPVVARLRASGAVLLGKTTVPEFAWKGVTDSRRHGATGNPHNPALTAGGSSGGSAAAVGAGMGAWSVGTDGGGSLRIPAAFTGTVTIKPTYGLVPMYPASPFGTLAHAGPMTRTVTDTARMLDVLCGFDSRDWSALPTPEGSFLDGLEDGVQGLRVAFSATLGYVHNDPEIEALVRTAVGLLADQGADVEEIDPPFTDPVEIYHTLWFTGAEKVVRAYGAGALDQVDPALRRGIEEYGRVSAADYLDATGVRMDIGVRMGAFHERFDLLLTPTLPIPAFPTGQDAPDPDAGWTSWASYTFPFNLTQQPAASVPCGLTSHGLPAGLQIVGARHADRMVLRAARAYERAAGWPSDRPVHLTGLREPLTA